MHKSIMNKIIFFLASMIAAVAFTSPASALPLFARQTGMECAACHFQHFPMLTAFGRAFKSGAFTLIGAQGKVEGDNLSIPAVLNAAILTTAGYVKTNATSAPPAATNAGWNNDGNGTIYVPGTNGEFSLFVGGRTSDFSGALAEIGLVQNGGTGAGVASAKFPMLWEVGDNGTRAGLVPFTTDGQGASYGFETLNTGANAVHTMLFIGGDANGSVAPALSAQQYIGTATAATGAAFVVNNPNFFVNVTRFNKLGPADLRGGSADGVPPTAVSGTQSGADLSSTYLRAAYIFDLAGWDSAVGVQSWSGTSTDPADALGILQATDNKATAIDGQMQGTLSGMPVGFYASYATAPSVTATGTTDGNAFNGGPYTKSALNFSAELGVIPQKATIGFGIRRGKSGDFAGSGIAGSNDSDNAILVEASYKLAQNMLLNLVYVSQSGDYWSTANSDAVGSKQTSINLATIF
jgi:hypothetical protein